MKAMIIAAAAVVETSRHAPSAPSTIKAETIVPTSTKGERKIRRKKRFKPSWVCWVSLVMRVIRLARPRRSTSSRGKVMTWWNRSSLSAVPNCAASFDEKYCATTEMP